MSRHSKQGKNWGVAAVLVAVLLAGVPIATAGSKPEGSRGETATAAAATGTATVVTAEGSWPKLPDGRPDFSKMNSADRQAYDAWRLKRTFG